MIKASLIRESMCVGLDYSFRELLHNHKRKQVDMSLGQQMSALHPNHAAERERDTGPDLGF